MRIVICVALIVCIQITLTSSLEVRMPKTNTTTTTTTAAAAAAAATSETISTSATSTYTTTPLPATTRNYPDVTTVPTTAESVTTGVPSTDLVSAVTEGLDQNMSLKDNNGTTTEFTFDEKFATATLIEVTKRDTVTGVPSTTSARSKTTFEAMLLNGNDFNSDRKCGIRPMHYKSSNRVKRIVGGSSANEGEWPWQVIVKEVKYLGTIADYKCGGVLISERHALTAAHCKPRAFLSTLVVILGQHRLHEKDLQTIPVTRMIVHKNFNEADFDNDLAVLELKYPVDFSSRIVPICLPDLDEEFVGRSGYVTGWGKLAHKGGLPKMLQNVKLPIIAREKCQQMFMKSGHVKKIHDYFLCAGYEGGQLDACEGDSGGPLSVQRPNGQWVLAGTVSHGIRCAEPNLPGVYMNISYYRAWINRMMSLHRSLRSPQEPEQRWFRPLWSVVDFYKKRKASVAYISK